MTHIAIQEAVDRKNVEWLEKVTDEQYDGSAASRDELTTCGDYQRGTIDDDLEER